MLRILASVSTITLALIATQAAAETVVLADGAPPQASSTTDKGSSDESGRGVQEIVVTAQRRAENVQKSSLSIQVLTSDDLQRSGVASARDLTTMMPSVQVTQSGAFTQTYIRGVGDYSANGFAQLAVSYNVDGVNIDRPSSIATNFYDLARVEVLKGPQGTLYGRNATGGAINLITNRPTDELEGYITGEYGNFDNKRVAGALNVPLSPELAARAAFQIVDRDGYLSDGTDDNVQQAGRLQLLWNADSGVSLRLSADYAHQGGKGTGSVFWPQQPGTGRWTAVSDPINQAKHTEITFGIAVPLGNDSSLDNEMWNFSAELNADLGDFATLTVIPAYRWQHLLSRTYTIGQLNDDDSKFKQKSLEVRLGNDSDALKWVVGGFYFDIQGDTRFFVDASRLIPFFSVIADFDDVGTKSYAAFGEATVTVADGLRLIGGARYTYEKKNIGGAYIDNSIFATPALSITASRSFDSFTWKAGFEYDVAPASMLYGTASKGFKSGGFFLAPNPDNTYDPEFLTSFTLGMRNRFLDNRLQFNIEAFYWKYRDQQASSVGYTSTGFITFATRNVGKSAPYGFDTDFVFRASDNDTISANVGYLRARYDKFDLLYPEVLAPTLNTACQVGGSVGTTFPSVVLDCSGFQFARAPKWSGSATYQHVFELGDGSTLKAVANATFASGRFLSIDQFLPSTYSSGYVLANFDLTYDRPDTGISVTAFVKNIFDKPVYLGSQANLFDNNYSHRTISAPRTYGIRATYSF
jgi:iron complex outermembrane receptor protein